MARLHMRREPHWIVTGFFAAALGATPWVVVGFALNVLIPIMGVVICCESLGRTYYWFAYWVPIALGAMVAGAILLAYATGPETTKRRNEQILDAGKAAMVVIGLCLLAVARSFGVI